MTPYKQGLFRAIVAFQPFTPGLVCPASSVYSPLFRIVVDHGLLRKVLGKHERVEFSNEEIFKPVMELISPVMIFIMHGRNKTVRAKMVRGKAAFIDMAKDRDNSLLIYASIKPEDSRRDTMDVYVRTKADVVMDQCDHDLILRVVRMLAKAAEIPCKARRLTEQNKTLGMTP